MEDSYESMLIGPEGLRAAVASFGQLMDSYANRGPILGDTATAPLLASWRELVKLLDIGPPTPRRSCPVCGHTGLRAATRCGYCWSTLAPLADETAEAGHAAATG